MGSYERLVLYLIVICSAGQAKQLTIWLMVGRKNAIFLLKNRTLLSTALPCHSSVSAKHSPMGECDQLIIFAQHEENKYAILLQIN